MKIKIHLYNNKSIERDIEEILPTAVIKLLFDEFGNDFNKVEFLYNNKWVTGFQYDKLLDRWS